MTGRIIHVGYDSQFTTYSSDVFEEVAPGRNTVWLLSDGAPGPVKHPPRSPEVRFAKARSLPPPRLVREARTASMVVAHAMTPVAAVLFPLLPSSVTSVWCGWGYDYYEASGPLDLSYLGPHTRALVASMPTAPRSSLVERAQVKVLDLARRRAAARTDFFSAPLPSDVEVLRSHYPGFRGAYHHLNYADVDATFAGPATHPGARDVLVGNSATATNNHADVFRLLATLDLGERRVITPLTYGDDAYRDAVITDGKAVLGERFVPVVDHLPLADYLALTASCSVVVFAHQRQQGLGNIGAAMHRGAHLYLADSSPLVPWLRANGMTVGQTSELVKGLPDAPQDPQVTEQNRAGLRSLYDRDVSRQHVRDLLART
jgi:dTDP-N-acetylfucosamine:lipid II N-acetylfucosaminyltransferase